MLYVATSHLQDVTTVKLVSNLPLNNFISL